MKPLIVKPAWMSISLYLAIRQHDRGLLNQRSLIRALDHTHLSNVAFLQAIQNKLSVSNL